MRGAVSIWINMMDQRVPRASGLEDVVAALTRLSDVDGEAGRLVIAGYPVESLSGNIRFEEAVFLLRCGRLPTPAEHGEVRAELGRARASASFAPVSLADPMDALRARMAQTEGDDVYGILGAMAVAAAGSTEKPNPNASHAEDYLRLATGRTPSAEQVAALDAYLVAVIDHGMNASTFTARVVASTASDMTSAVVAAIGALKGKLHGGAPGPVLDMLDAIGDAQHAHDWIAASLARGERIMGMGHRIYRTRDPRAFVLERAVGRMAATDRLALARAVEREAEAQLAAKHPDRPLKCNVEFYTAILLEAVGLPRALFTPTFAISRAAGWCAHVEEQRATGKLIRPRSTYVGELAP
jgi:citrate synthase